MTADERGAGRGAGAPNGRRTSEPARAPAPAELAGFGVQFIVAILLFLWIGHRLDLRFGTSPLLLVIGVFVGAGASFYSMYRRVAGGSRRRGDHARGSREHGDHARGKHER